MQCLKKGGGGHSQNIIILDDNYKPKVKIIEPQTDEIISIEDWKKDRKAIFIVF